MNKAQELEKVNDEIRKCKICLIDKIGMAVPGEGSAMAEVVFIGEAPGKKEAVTGRPFIGRSGNLLRSLIADAGLKVEEVYITSSVKYLPKKGTPTSVDIVHGRIHLLKQLAIIQPKYIVLLGSTAVQAVLGEKLLLMKVHGTVVHKDGSTYFIILHPAAVLRNPGIRNLIFQDFEKLRQLLSAPLNSTSEVE